MGRLGKRREDRKYKRLHVRFGTQVPEHHAVGMHISTGGLFLSTNSLVFATGSRIVVEIKGPDRIWIVPAVVRHAIKVHRDMARFAKPGMGIELADVPPDLREFLSSL